jgi:hypothetical protein
MSIFTSSPSGTTTPVYSGETNRARGGRSLLRFSAAGAEGTKAHRHQQRAINVAIAAKTVKPVLFIAIETLLLQS